MSEREKELNIQSLKDSQSKKANPLIISFSLLNS
jgi:hypothetical protein